MNNTNFGSSCGMTTGTATCTKTPGTTCDINDITTPGAYLCNWNGSLLRVTESFFTNGACSYFNFSCTTPMTVTCLTDDPTTSLDECREMACNAGYDCCF